MKLFLRIFVTKYKHLYPNKMGKNFIAGFILIASVNFYSCKFKTDTHSATENNDKPAKTQAGNSGNQAVPDKPASAAVVSARPQIPVLCYHQIRDWRPADSKSVKEIIVPVALFQAQLKMLADSGYHTILPDELYDYLNKGTKLQPKPIMLTFDDNDLDQYTAAVPEMKKYGFKGVFFIMTVTIGRPRYMSKAQIKELSDSGHVIASHTWDHHRVDRYQGDDWITQIEKPKKALETITGKPVKYFAYPFGLWNKAAIPELKKHGFTAAFALAEKRDDQDPLFTIRRIIGSGYWSPHSLHASIIKSF